MLLLKHHYLPFKHRGDLPRPQLFSPSLTPKHHDMRSMGALSTKPVFSTATSEIYTSQATRPIEKTLIKMSIKKYYLF